MFLKRYLAHSQGDYKTGQVDIVGIPTLTNSGIASGFSTSNYLKTPMVIDLSNANSWEIGMKLTTGSTVSGSYDFFGCAISEGNALGMLVNNGKWLFSVGRNGSWISSAEGTNTVLTNTEYWIKLEFTGSNYIFSFSTDGQTWIEDKNVSSTTKITAGTYGYIGRSSPWLNRSFNGSINLVDCYIKADNSYIWNNKYLENIYQNKCYSLTAKKKNYYKYSSWTQPTFTSDTTWGVVSADSNANNEYPWRALENSDLGYGLLSGSTGNWYWIFAEPLYVKSIPIRNRALANQYGGQTTYTIYGLQNDGSYELLGSIVLEGNADAQGSLVLDTPTKCYGLKIYLQGSLNYAGMRNIKLEAYTAITGNENDYNFEEYKNTNYFIVNPKNKQDVSEVLYQCYYNSTSGIYCYAELPIEVGDKLYGKSGGWTAPVSNSSELVWDNVSTIATIGDDFIVDTLNIEYQRNSLYDLYE